MHNDIDLFLGRLCIRSIERSNKVWFYNHWYANTTHNRMLLWSKINGRKSEYILSSVRII